jgi:gliding motility-associated-like protein
LDINIQVIPMTVQTLQYDTTRYCQGPGTATVQLPFTFAGGTFTSVPVTSSLTPSTGDIDLSTINAGSYSITFTPAGGCENPVQTTIQIDSLVAATYDYNPTYCIGSANNTPASITFLPPGGYFYEATGNLHFLDSITGELDLNTSFIGTYNVEYVVTGGCINLTSDVVSVEAAVNASFTVDSSMCSNVDSVQAISALTGGVFSSPGGQILFHDTLTGLIDVPNSTVGGPFTIVYSMPHPTCPDTVQHHITIAPAPTATIQYSSDNYCEKAFDPAAIFLGGAAGGNLSISGTGVIDSVSGLIDLDSSGPGNYVISYAVNVSGCSASFPVDTVDILQMPETGFSLVTSLLCQGSGLYPIDTILPAVGATSVFTMANGQFANLTGAIQGTNIDTDVLPSGGPFRIVRTVDDGTCLDSLVQFVWVSELEDPNFVYVPDTFCQTDRSPVPLILGDGGGTFLEVNIVGTDTLSLNSQTGLIILLDSEPATHFVEYTTGGPCPQRDTFELVVTSSIPPSFSYAVNSYCETDTSTVLPIQFPTAAHTFTVSPPGLVLVNSGTGELDIAASTPGNYNVILTLDSTGGNCPTEAVVSIEILAYNNSSISFDSVVCLTDSFLQITFDTTLSGVFFAPSGLVWENRDTGLVAVYATLPGTYLIRYEVQGVCQERFQDSLTVEVPTFPDFDFPGGDREFCRSNGVTFATAADTSGGTFTWVNVQQTQDTTGLLLDSLSGILNLAGSNSGTYDITYTTNTACKGDTTKRIIVYPNPLNALMLLEPGDSICAGDPLTISGSGASYTKIRINGADSSNSLNFTAENLQDGDVIEMVFITQQQCRDSTDTIITVLARPDGLPIVGSPTISGNEGIIFEMASTVDMTSFVWDLDSIGRVSFPRLHDSIPPVPTGSTGQIASTPTLANGFDPAQAIFVITPSAYGCYGEPDTVRIRINPNNQPIFIPEVFTPNGDESNDTWEIQWNNDIVPTEYTILVFNRSGGRVYTMDGLKRTWNGDNNPDGVYWWQMYHGPDEVLLRGAVTIRRNNQ